MTDKVDANYLSLLRKTLAPNGDDPGLRIFALHGRIGKGG
jgi:hypothetical protein